MKSTREFLNVTRVGILEQLAKGRRQNSILDSAPQHEGNILEAMDIWAIAFGEWMEHASMTNPNIPVHVKYQMFKDQIEKK